MSEYIPDALDLFRAHDAEQERRLAERPRCDHCGEYIQQEYAVRIDGRWICDSCLEDYREAVD